MIVDNPVGALVSCYSHAKAIYRPPYKFTKGRDAVPVMKSLVICAFLTNIRVVSFESVFNTVGASVVIAVDSRCSNAREVRFWSDVGTVPAEPTRSGIGSCR